MKPPTPPPDEIQRLRELHSYEVLDTAREPAFDRITQLASTLFDVPIALVSLVDEARQWFKSARGLDALETARDISFCGHAILDDQPMVVSDALQDERFVDNPLVTGAPDIRFYAGAPLITPRGLRIGTLCLIDRKPRELTQLQRGVLSDLAALVVDQLELRSARALQERETAEMRALLQTFPTPIVVVSEGVVRFSNTQCDELLGYPPGQVQGLPQVAIVHPDEANASLQVAREAITPGAAPLPVHRRLRRADGEIRTVEGTAGRLSWAGRPAVMVALRDVTRQLYLEAQREAETALVNRELTLMLEAFDVVPDGIILFDPQFRCVYANQAIGTMFGVPQQLLRDWTPDDAARHVASLTGSSENRPTREQLRQVSVSAADGLVFELIKPVRRVLRRTLHALGSPTHPWLSVWHDITLEAAELKQRQEEALTDALTGLPNRRAIEPRLERARVTGGRATVALFDVDHFKRVNDTYGHEVGDEVLRQVANVMRRSARDGDVVARWGGEEFIALLRADLGARHFAERVRKAVAELETSAGPITISCGLSDVSGDSPVRQADARLYQAKHEGRNLVRG